MNLEPIWGKFKETAQLSATQLNQFVKYAELIQDWNDRVNLTSILENQKIIDLHFLDSLSLASFMDLTIKLTLTDVGSGAGFPAIPLKIKYPNLRIILIEVNLKKIEFLQAVIDELGLENIEIYDQDWRTFLRKTNDHVDLFCARASLKPLELLRVFKAGCIYRQAKLVYWAADHWDECELGKAGRVPDNLARTEWGYLVGDKTRKLICWKLNLNPENLDPSEN